MFYLRLLQLLHILNVRNRNRAYNGDLGNFANIVTDNIDKFCFRKSFRTETESLMQTLADYRCVKYDIVDGRIKKVTLTHVGAHYPSFIFLAFCKSVLLPIIVSAIIAFLTSIITVSVTL